MQKVKLKHPNLPKSPLKNLRSSPETNDYSSMHLSMKRLNADPGEVSFIPKTAAWRNLLAAMINQAVNDLTHPDNHQARTAFVWLHSKSSDAWSFRWCLTNLDISLEYGRKLIQLGLNGGYGE